MIVTNNRIQELAEHAKKSIPTGTLGVTEWIAEYNRKFAELIIGDIEDEVSRLKRRVDVLEAELLHPK